MNKLLFLVALAVPLFSAQGAVPNAPQTSTVRKVAFDRLGDSPWGQVDIFVLDSPSSKPRHLVSGMNPVWSPDGEKIAYCVREGLGTRHIGIGQMHLINADGSGDKQLTNLEGGACPCDWSADGLLAFFHNNEISVIIRDSNFARKIASGGGARWSPDGKKLVFLRPTENSQSSHSIWIVNADGTDARKVIDDESQVLEAIWGADGNSILFTSTREHKRQAEIFRVNLDGTGVQVVATDKHLSLFSPVLSPDGRSLVADGIAGDEKNVLLLDLASRRTSVLARGLHASVLWTGQ